MFKRFISRRRALPSVLALYHGPGGRLSVQMLYQAPEGKVKRLNRISVQTFSFALESQIKRSNAQSGPGRCERRSTLYETLEGPG